jgi:hypothetical protein
MKINYLVLAPFLFPSFLFAQNGLSFYGGFSGSNSPMTYAQHGNVLRSALPDSGRSYYSANLCASMQYRMKNISLEAGYHGNEFWSKNIDVDYIKRYPTNYDLLTGYRNNLYGNDNMATDIFYTSLYGTLSLYVPLEKGKSARNSLYLSVGASDNILRGPSSGTKLFYDSGHNETLRLDYHCVNSYVGLVAEAGWNWVGGNHRTYAGKNGDHTYSVYLGARYTTAFEQVVTTDFTDTQNDKVINTDHAYTNGDFIGGVFRVGVSCGSGICFQGGSEKSTRVQPAHFKVGEHSRSTAHYVERKKVRVKANKKGASEARF